MENDPAVTEDTKSPGFPWRNVVIGGVAAGIGSGLSQAISFDRKIRLLAGGLVGGALGYLVYRFARKRGQEKLGHTAWLCCAAAGSVLGLVLACPVALAFYFVIRSRGFVPKEDDQLLNQQPPSDVTTQKDARSANDVDH